MKVQVPKSASGVYISNKLTFGMSNTWDSLSDVQGVTIVVLLLFINVIYKKNPLQFCLFDADLIKSLCSWVARQHHSFCKVSTFPWGTMKPDI